MAVARGYQGLTGQPRGLAAGGSRTAGPVTGPVPPFRARPAETALSVFPIH